MTESLHPTAGVRLLLEHKSDDASGATYDGAVFTPDARHDYRVTFRLPGGDVELLALGQSIGADLLRAQARVLARQAVSSTPPVWPRRLLRWRETR